MVGGRVEKKMMSLKLGSSKGEGACLEAWEMTGTKKEDGIAENMRINSARLYGWMGIMGWK